MRRRLAVASTPLVVAGCIVAVVALAPSHRHHVLPPVAPAAAHAHAARHHQRGSRALPAPPAQVRGDAARRMAIPILLYHVVATPPPSAPYPQLWVDPATFAAEMRALHRAGYWAITMQRAWAAWTRGGALPRKPVIVSFDDGYRGDYTHARPVLRALGWPGVLNLELHNVGPNNLRASEVRGLIRAGWEIASHTVTHPDLTTASPARVRDELVRSRVQLRRRFGVRARFFCYPYGHYDAQVEAAVRAAGYSAATTEDEGYATAANPYALRRIRVNRSDTSATLLARLAAERPS